MAFKIGNKAGDGSPPRESGANRISLTELSLYIGAVAIIVIFTIVCEMAGRQFLTLLNIRNIITQASVVAIISIGASIVILTGGIDLSSGSIVGFTGIFAGLIMKSGQPVWFACVAAILAGCLFGLFNGLFVSYGKVPAFITTLGVMQAARGLALLLNKGKPISQFPDELSAIMNYRIFSGVPLSVVYVFVLYIIIIIVMNKTKFGRYVYALGGNAQAAKLSGVRVKQIEILVYVLGGMFAAIGGVLLLSRLSYADPNAGSGYEMSAIAATVIGGISLSGGKGKIVNTLVGALILSSLTCGLQILNVAVYFQTIITGLVIIIAVFLDKTNERRAE
jgi:ribose transport system permease protein